MPAELPSDGGNLDAGEYGDGNDAPFCYSIGCQARRAAGPALPFDRGFDCRAALTASPRFGATREHWIVVRGPWGGAVTRTNRLPAPRFVSRINNSDPLEL